MHIKIKTLEGTEVQLEVDKSMKIRNIKELLQEKEAISVEQQRLIYGGKQLVDANTLETYSIQNNDVLHLVLALRGG
ncbi:ubiquitin-like protein Nedd8 [Nematocida ausubeli]|uniref:Ubiquitin n=1 Tax=Nematocida ausubeli (strain ATCC PRA-371 / ERTm2) TaxID=1913371 RepID=H8ZG08_NEMA1|nr:uncharacterized protein NESG_00542 [Nematocida ausubeli]EHY64452.1 ubiquitin [Nematocida ausubeli]KAI5134216.1 ubiquitin-like protein Nedd8 [Nematocida ausubeli]KAI5135446.1 ubiquitin-like protein Nedd8 [Nematocida ausubeli]KAI5135911.1 ubiquitin-like protein Nedd8 [Nematocida ausubeli]KAI5148586.1 ubiquitin-like protein Nedd8 [Nematocida ausubeli]